MLRGYDKLIRIMGKNNSNTGAGYIVVTPKGTKGRTYHNKELINGKIAVYPKINGTHNYRQAGILCDPKTLIYKGSID